MVTSKARLQIYVTQGATGWVSSMVSINTILDLDKFQQHLGKSFHIVSGGHLIRFVCATTTTPTHSAELAAPGESVLVYYASRSVQNVK